MISNRRFLPYFLTTRQLWHHALKILSDIFNFLQTMLNSSEKMTEELNYF